MPLPCCPSCRRHVKACEPACPFCGKALPCRASYVLASGLAALALAACQAPAGVGSQVVASPAPVASASLAPSPTAVQPSPTPAPTPTPLMQANPVASAPAPSYGKSTIISGMVYDEDGIGVDGAIIRVTSLDASVPYTASTTTFQGSWVVNNLPEGANVEIVAWKEGWTSRRRVGTFQTRANVKNEVDFGGETQADGRASFLSDYPEIAAVEPGYDAIAVDGSAVSYKLTLSERLDAANRERFANALRLFPANHVAAPENDGTSGGAGFTDLTNQKITGTGAVPLLDRPVDPDPAEGYRPAAAPNHPAQGVQPKAPNPLPWDYGIKNGTSFLNDADTTARVSWNDAGTVATLSFAAPLVADHASAARYQVGLVAPTSTDRIVDAGNHQLGMDAAGRQDAYPLPGSLLHATIKEPVLSLGELAQPTGATRWIATHQDVAPFAVKVETDAPRLLSVAYAANLGASSRFELAFSKPLAAYNGRPGGHVGEAIRTGALLDALSLAVSDRTGGTAGINLKGGQVGLVLDPNAGPFGSIEQEFRLQGGSSAAEPYGEDLRVAEGDATKAGRYLLAVDPKNPRTLFIYVIGRRNVFDPRIVEWKVRAPGISDQAGNVIQPADADRQQTSSSAP